MAYVTRSGSEFRYEGRRFRFIGFNFYPFLVDNYSSANMHAYMSAAAARGVKVIRTWCFDAGKPPSNTAGNFRYESGGVLNWREASFIKLDTLLDVARQYGLKLYLCLADNTTNYDTKATYVGWANTVYSSGLSTSFPQTGFFDSDDCRTIYKQFIDKLVNRVNTINGRTYKNDDTWNLIDLGNELRYDVFDAEGGTQNSTNSTNIIKVLDWMDEMSTYVKSVAPNLLVSVGGAEHTWQWVNGDTVSNGSGYGRDYGKEADLTNVDFIDVHCYPNQGGSELLKYGQRLGYPNAISGDGFRAQLRDYVTVAKAKSKPAVMGEVGFVAENPGSNIYFPLNPRTNGLTEICNEWFKSDGDGLLIWHGGLATESYNIDFDATGGEFLDTNSNDTRMMSYIYQKNYRLNGRRIPADAQRGFVL